MNRLNDTAIEEARRAGFDLNLIEMNLSLPPEERSRQHDMALEVILELEEARTVSGKNFSRITRVG